MDMPAGETASRVDAQACVRRIVLFDFDGVLFRGDAYARFLRTRYARSWWRMVLLLPLLPALMPLAASARGRRLMIRVSVLWALCGLDERRYRVLAGTFGRALARDARNFQRGAITALNGHRQAGDRVLVVTGCEETLARAILDELGLPMIELVASRLVPGRFGMRIAVHTIGREKLRQLAAHGIAPPWHLAYSDSASDLPMLAGAQAAVLVNAQPRLLRRVARALGREIRNVDWAGRQG